MEDLTYSLKQLRRMWIEGDFTEACALYEHLLQEYPTTPLILLHYGLILYAGAQEMERAVTLLERFLIFKPSLVALLGMGELYAIRYGPKRVSLEAIPIFSEVIARAGTNTQAAYIAWFQIALIQSTFEERIASYQQAIQVDPINPAAYYNIAMEYKMQGIFQEAWNVLKETEVLFSEAVMPTRSDVQNILQKLVRREPFRAAPGRMVESVLTPWFQGKADEWE